MTAKDTITLPREVVEYAIAALESSLVRAPGGTTRRERDSITALRTALAAEQPKPVTLSRVALAWSNRKGTKFVGNGEKWKHEDCVVPLYTAARVDEPSEDIEALRRDAERWRWHRAEIAKHMGRSPESIDASIDAAMKEGT